MIKLKFHESYLFVFFQKYIEYILSAIINEWSSSLFIARMINKVCTAQCETADIVSRYKLSYNSDKLALPLVNPEIWNDMAKKAQTYDKFLRDIQTLVAIGMVPVITLSEGLRNQIFNNAKAKTKISDAISLFGYAQFNLSLRMR